LKKKIANLFIYLKIGLLNTCFGYLTYAIFLLLGFSYGKSLFLATALGILFNYITFGRFVFNCVVDIKSLLKFITLYLLIYLVNFYLLLILSNTTNLGPYIAQLISIPFVTFLNWLGFNFWVYEKR